MLGVQHTANGESNRQQDRLSTASLNNRKSFIHVSRIVYANWHSVIEYSQLNQRHSLIQDASHSHSLAAGRFDLI
jgi:hypothetical protein